MYGEISTSRAPDDIAHWIAAYSELVEFKNRLLVDMDRGMEALSGPATAEIKELDVNLIVLQRARYIRRLDFWKGRQAEIGAKTRAGS